MVSTTVQISCTVFALCHLKHGRQNDDDGVMISKVTMRRRRRHESVTVGATPMVSTTAFKVLFTTDKATMWRLWRHWNVIVRAWATLSWAVLLKRKTKRCWDGMFSDDRKWLNRPWNEVIVGTTNDIVRTFLLLYVRQNTQLIVLLCCRWPGPWALIYYLLIFFSKLCSLSLETKYVFLFSTSNTYNIVNAAAGKERVWSTFHQHSFESMNSQDFS